MPQLIGLLIGIIIAVFLIVTIVTVVAFIFPFALVGSITGGVLGWFIGWYNLPEEITITEDEKREQYARIKAIDSETERKIAHVENEIKQVLSEEWITSPLKKESPAINHGVSASLISSRIAIIALVASVIVISIFIIISYTKNKGTQKASTHKPVIVVSKNNVNIRATPSTSSKVIATANQGTRLASLGTNANWYHVKFQLRGKEKDGWIYKSLTDQYSKQPLEKKVTQKPDLKIIRSVVSEKLDSNNKPEGFYTSFPINDKYVSNRSDYVIYYAEYDNASVNNTWFNVQWFSGGKKMALAPDCRKIMIKSSGSFWCKSGRSLPVGNYEVRLFANEKEVSRKQFTINSRESTVNKVSVSTKSNKTTSSYPKVNVTSKRLDFGKVKLHRRNNMLDGGSINRTIVISNTGKANLLLNKINSPKSPFKIGNNGCHDKLKPNQRCRIVVNFSPAKNTQNDKWITGHALDKTYKDKLIIYTNDNNITVSLIGKAFFDSVEAKENRRSRGAEINKSFAPPSESLR